MIIRRSLDPDRSPNGDPNRDPARSAQPAAVASAAATLAERYAAIRRQTEALAAPLSEADAQAQSMPDASPVKWHLAHVSWFFETFVLAAFEPGFVPHHAVYRVLFNSYYNGIGEQHPRPQRGLVTRPGLAEVLAYRHAVDERMQALLAKALPDQALQRIELGLQHEQQHQELILTDLRHLLACNPLDPVYRAGWPLALVAAPAAGDRGFTAFEGGLVEIGHRGQGFAFDNEGPRHHVWLEPYALANRLVTHGDWLAFIADGGYRDARWWLSAGWDWVRRESVAAPLYWRAEGEGGWSNFTLHGRVAVDALTPVVNISFFEADAFARWFGEQHADDAPTRLPTEAEWEAAAEPQAAAALAEGNFVESGALHPMPAAVSRPGLTQVLGDVWVWTRSAYAPYPGFRAWDGDVGEYNAKFMLDQQVLRGGSCATPHGHIRTSYRNFFPAAARWQFSGLRLARDAAGPRRGNPNPAGRV